MKNRIIPNLVKTTSKEKKNNKGIKEPKETKRESSDITEKKSFVTIIIVGPEDVGTILDTTEVELKMEIQYLIY